MNDINSAVVGEPHIQSEESLNVESTKTEENLVSKIIFLMDQNPNYKMLGALCMMLANFSVCVTFAHWLKNSSLVS